MRPGTAGPAAAPGLRARVLADGAALERERAGWDALAVAAGRPYGAPGWALPWARPSGPRAASSPW